MREWKAGFELLSADWLLFDVRSLDGAERLAQRVADRGGERNGHYAEAVYPELKAIQAGAEDRGAAPVAVLLPHEPGDERPLVPATAMVVAQDNPDAGRTVDAIAEMVRVPRPYRLDTPEVKEVRLPLGPACRVRELVYEAELEDGRELITEHLTHYVLPPCYPEGVLQLTVTWSLIGLGHFMSEVADDMAASLTLEPVD